MKELDILLFWYQIPKTKWGDKKKKLKKWKEVKSKKHPYLLLVQIKMRMNWMN